MNRNDSKTLCAIGKMRWTLVSIFLLAIFLLATVGHAAVAPSAMEQPRGQTPLTLPLRFVPNAGQLDEAVRFKARQGRHTLLVGVGETTLVSEPSHADGTPAVVRMRFVGAGPEIEVEGRERLPGVANFYHGNNPERWIQGLPTYGATAQVGIYEGITQVYRAANSFLKSEFLVAPGADVTQILMRYSGIEALEITGDGELLVRTAQGEWRESAPVAYQQIGSRRLPVAAGFRLLEADLLGFAIGSYDPAHELVIDPTFIFSTYLGGEDSDSGGGIAVDNDGNILLVGTTRSTTFPLVSPVQGSKAGPVDSTANANDMFVAKLDPTGSTLLYSTYLGGAAREFGADIGVDGDGNAHLVGWTASVDFPTTAGVLGPGPFGVGGSTDDAVVVKLDAAGGLIYSTYLGGSGDDQVEDIAVDGEGHAVVMGHTSSANFPTTPLAYQPAHQGIWDVFVSKLNLDGSALVYSTFLGDTGYEEPRALALDNEGSAYILGRTQSPNFPVTGGVYDAVYNGTDTVFLSKLGSLGSNLIYSTFLDGVAPRFESDGFDVAVDATGHAYAVVPSVGTGFSATLGAFDETFNGATDLVVMKVKPDGSGPLLYSTYLGGLGAERGHGISVDSCGGVTVTGFTESADFPSVDPLVGQSSLGGVRDAFVARLGPAGTTLAFASFLGGAETDSGADIALGVHGNCIVGSTASTDFPSFGMSPFQPAFAGGTSDAFALCLGDPPGNVSCRIFDDINGNGIQDAGEPGKEGVEILVINSQNLLEIVTTDVDGDCSITVTPGETTFNIDEGSLPPGSVWTVGTNPTTITVPPCGTVNLVNGCQQQGALACHLFEDQNGNGSQDVGERNKAGVDVVVTDSQGNSQTLTTDSSGDCSTVVPAGSTVLDIDDSTLPPGAVLPPGSDPTTVNVPAGGALSAFLRCWATADLAIEKTNGQDGVVSGGLVSYTVQVTNQGPGDVFGAVVSDPFPGLLGVSWTCSATAGSSCTPSGSGGLNDVVNVLAGGTLTYRALGTVAPSDTNSVVNTATVSEPGGVIDPDPENNSAMEVDDISAAESCPCARSFTLRGGLMDDFLWPLPAGEQAFRSAALEAVFPSATWKNFDDPTNDRFFGHTFTNLPAGIVSAVLEIRMKPNSSLSTNDSFGMALDNGVELYATPISSLPEANGTWHGSMNQPTIFLLNLGTLNGGAPLAQVVSDGFLDLRVEDDTVVDYVKLHLVFCRSPLSSTRRCGLKDDLAPPADPIARSVALDSTYPGVSWKDLDDFTPNAFVGHAFTNLPAGLLGAQLELRMQPHAGNSTNDTLNLALLPGGTFGYGSFISDLPEAAGTWINNPATVFNLDLDAEGVLPQMATDRFLDVLVSDDTAVDYMELQVQSCRRRLIDALPWVELGDALLLPTGEDNFELVGIDGPGGNGLGDNGLEVDLGEAEGYCLETEAVCLGAEGTGLQLVATGHVVNFNQNTVTGTLTFSPAAGNNVDLTVGFSPPFALNAEVQVYNNGVLGTTQYLATGAVARVPEDTCFNEFDFIDRCFRVLLTDPVPVTVLQGGPTVVGDEIHICRDIIVGMKTVLNSFRLTASNLPSLTVTGGSLQIFGQLHKPLGGATFIASGDALTISDLGASGEDGVAIALDQAQSFDLALVDLDPLGTAAPGALVRARAIGSLNGIPGQPLGELTITQTGSEGGVESFAFNADFSALDSPSQRVQILSGGEMVADFPEHTGTAALASTWPLGLGKLGGTTECFVGRHPPLTTFSVDGAEFVGDEIRILSEGTATVEFKSSFLVLAAGLGEFTIVHEAAVSGHDIFSDGFETGDTSSWSVTVGGTP